MTLLASKVTYYWRCQLDPEHTFETTKNDPGEFWFCPECGSAASLYGLADSTRYTSGDDQPSDLPASLRKG